MKTIFDKVTDRRGSSAIKTDWLKEYYGREDLIPLWIADMDFQTPDFIVSALKKRMEHPIFGYFRPDESYWHSIIAWEKRIHNWDVKREELSFMPGIVRGIAYAIQCFTNPGDGIVVQPPVYMPFIHLPEQNGRKLLYNPLKYICGQYEMDFNQLADLCEREKPKMLILSNPHNPAGRVWSVETLRKLADICSKYNVIVISDEIHAEMALFGNVHVPFAAASETAQKISITFAAPSKTFNIAGIISSFVVVKDEEIRKKFYNYLEANEFNAPMMTSVIATQAAYTDAGDKWRIKMLNYVEANVRYVTDFLGVNVPQISVVRPQASFLVWLNCKMLGLSHDALIDLFVNKAHLALNDGEAFGPGGEGYMRMNVGCPRQILETAMQQLKEAVEKLHEN